MLIWPVSRKFLEVMSLMLFVSLRWISSRPTKQEKVELCFRTSKLKVFKESQPTHNELRENYLFLVPLYYSCLFILQVFDTKIALSIHAGRIHKTNGREKNYQCHICVKSFHNSSYLSQHMRIHTGQKPYACTVCSKKFTQLSHRQQHERTHSGRPLQIRWCSFWFTWINGLQFGIEVLLNFGWNAVYRCETIQMQRARMYKSFQPAFKLAKPHSFSFTRHTSTQVSSLKVHPTEQFSSKMTSIHLCPCHGVNFS